MGANTRKSKYAPLFFVNQVFGREGKCYATEKTNSGCKIENDGFMYHSMVSCVDMQSALKHC